jgi:hypothetical protein
LGDFTRPWAVSSIKIPSSRNLIERTARASLLATIEVKYRDVSGGMLCALSISRFPLKVESNRGRTGQRWRCKGVGKMRCRFELPNDNCQLEIGFH